MSFIAGGLAAVTPSYFLAAGIDPHVPVVKHSGSWLVDLSHPDDKDAK